MTVQDLIKQCAVVANCDKCLYIPVCNKYRKLIEKATGNRGSSLMIPTLLNEGIDQLIDIYHAEIE